MANLYEYYEGPADGNVTINGSAVQRAQTFIPALTHPVGSVKLVLWKGGITTSTTFTLAIRATNTSTGKPTGSDLCSGTFDGNTCSTDTTNGAEKTITFSTNPTLTAGTKYAIVMYSASSDSGHYVAIRDDATSPAYPTLATTAIASDFYSADTGSTWTAFAFDWVFYEYGIATVTLPGTDAYTAKRLACCANGEVWLETAAGGTMEQLTDSVGSLNTSDFISMFELYGKAFIVNRSIKKVVDLVNTKLTTTDIKPSGKVIPLNGTVLTGGTSGAMMVTDYIDNTDGSCNVYGKRTTAVTFASGESVTGQVTSAADVTFVLSAAEDAPPHYYNWTVYSLDTTTYGTIPANVTLGCNYRGRATLSGDPLSPHQWYMSRQGNPWNWIYVPNDPLSAVVGNNTDAGGVGDIVRTLSPYGDDFLVFGGANSIHLLDGDPCMSGSIDQISDCTGVYGPQAWCKDNQGNLYFYGLGGLYRMVGGREKPVNISSGTLPKLVDDWAAEPATHRIILSFDPIRNGIIISRTTLATGANLNYWYDLTIEGFYPETYPAVCGIYSSFDYNSNKSATRKLLLGCEDGYLRSFSNSAKDDDTGVTDTLISSYAVLPIVKMNEKDDSEGKLTSMTVVSAGGTSSTTFGNTDGFSYELHKGKDAETVLENIKDAATAQASGTLTGTGRQNCIRARVRGRWLGIKLYNSTAAQTWAVNSIEGKIIPAGRIK